jgi:hypothetical protein
MIINAWKWRETLLEQHITSSRKKAKRKNKC